MHSRGSGRSCRRRLEAGQPLDGLSDGFFVNARCPLQVGDVQGQVRQPVHQTRHAAGPFRDGRGGGGAEKRARRMSDGPQAVFEVGRTPIPEPATGILAMLGLLVLACVRRRGR